MQCAMFLNTDFYVFVDSKAFVEQRCCFFTVVTTFEGVVRRTCTVCKRRTKVLYEKYDGASGAAYFKDDSTRYTLNNCCCNYFDK